jgi:hypothetical protein
MRSSGSNSSHKWNLFYSACEAPLLHASCDRNLFWFLSGEFFSATFGFFTASLRHCFHFLYCYVLYFFLHTCFMFFSIDVEWGMSATARCLGFGG